MSQRHQEEDQSGSVRRATISAGHSKSAGDLPYIVEECSEELRSVASTNDESSGPMRHRLSEPFRHQSAFGFGRTSYQASIGGGSGDRGGYMPSRMEELPDYDDAINDFDDEESMSLKGGENNNETTEPERKRLGLAGLGLTRPLSRNSRSVSEGIHSRSDGGRSDSSSSLPSVSPSMKSPRASLRKHSSQQGQGSGGNSSPFSGVSVSDGSGGALGSVGGFTSKMSRKSQNFRHSIAKHSGGALARLTRHTSSGADGDSKESDDENRAKKSRRYGIDDSVLISNHGTNWANCVNRHGYPPGSGTSPEEKVGPYIFILGTIKTVHYEENAVFYTVTRVDTGSDLRGDPNYIEPILTQEGEEAARTAAAEFQVGRGLTDDRDEDADTNSNEHNDGAIKVLENILGILLLPFLLVYDIFVLVIGARLLRWSQKSFVFTKRQATAFLNGGRPYHCSTVVTTVNLIVVCNIWYMFVDQARLAFFPTESDDALAVINCVIWFILFLELIFEVFIRPDNYCALIQSEKAYMPTTARFISGAHLAIEAVSLAFFVPEFLCLFQEDLQCDERRHFSFGYATLLAISGPTRSQSFWGRCFYACIRLRIFSLVRLWKNMWLNKKYIMRGRSIERYQNHENLALTTTEKSRDDDEITVSTVSSGQMRLEQKERNEALINASNIGTALMVTNSYRALAILVTIVGVLPMISLIFYSAVANVAPTDMVDQLQASNVLITVENQTNCEFLVDSVDSWSRSWHAKDHGLITSETDNFLVVLVIHPARCLESFESLEVGDLRFSQAPCAQVENKYHMNLDKDGRDVCIVGTLRGSMGHDLRSIAEHLDLRRGNLQLEQSNRIDSSLVLEDGTSAETSFGVAACFNQTHAIESSALASFILQFCLLLTVLGGLSMLRRDAEDLVLGPLRSMLKIVARYARNPLAQAGHESNRDNQSTISDSDSYESSRASDEDGGFGTYETEQLITAVAKITDLLRKCWGVAGADIISTNLASREGALAEVFNPTVPGKSVYALFAFAAINGFDHALKCLGGDVMILINDVARVLHDEVYRWGFGDSGQCNKNLGAAFLMVFRIGLVKEVREKLEEATKVVFSTSDTKKLARKRSKTSPGHVRTTSDGNRIGFGGRLIRSRTTGLNDQDVMADAMKLSLQSLPGISTFTDRAVLGMLKSFAGIHRDNKLRGWSRDFRLSAGVGAFEVNMIFGMDAGWAVEGAVGSEYKIDATYLSPHVNNASRMMSACKQYGVTILLSEAVQELMSETAKSRLRNVDRVTVKGSVNIQKIYTFDARHKGADFFLFSRSDYLADLDAEQYAPSIWTTDQDLQAMRHHVTEDFEAEFNAGIKAYYAGDWPKAIQRLERANEIMVDAAMEEGYLHDEMDNTPDRKELYRNETSDGPCSYLVTFMKSKGGVAPEGWSGWHPLLSK